MQNAIVDGPAFESTPAYAMPIYADRDANFWPALRQSAATMARRTR